MPLRCIKHDLEILKRLKAIVYLMEFTKYILEKHPSIVTEFVEQYKGE